MKMKLITIILFIFFSAGCSNGGGEAAVNPAGNGTNNADGNTSGTITLAGDDTVTVGTKLDTGFVGSSLAASGLPDYIVVVDKSSTVTFTEPNSLTPVIADINNGFVLVVFDENSSQAGISMSIVTNGVKLNYACSTPVTVFIECGLNSINLDIASKTVTFDNATVTNTDTSTILTLNGSLTW